MAQTIASASVAPPAAAATAAPRDDCGGTWVRDEGRGRTMMGRERSKRRLLLKAARVQLERAQATVAAKGEHLKKKTNRGLVQAGGSLARGLRKILPAKGEGKEESELVANARLLAECTVSAAEVARIRELRMTQATAGRYAGRQRRAPPAPALAPAEQQQQQETAGNATEGPPARTAPAEHQAAGASTESSPDSSLAFDLVSDEELLYAYQTVLDELEASERADDAEEAEIMALAVSHMRLHPDLVDFAVTRLYELVGLDQDSGAQADNDARGGKDAKGDAVAVSHAIWPAAAAATQAGALLTQGGVGEEDDDDEFISAVCLNPQLAQRVAPRRER